MSKIISCILSIFLIISLVGCRGFPSSGTLKEPEQSDFTYAVIYYPDMKYSIEGYVDHYGIWAGNVLHIIIDGTTYYVDAKNCIIIKNKDLKVNKENKNE